MSLYDNWDSHFDEYATSMPESASAGGFAGYDAWKTTERDDLLPDERETPMTEGERAAYTRGFGAGRSQGAAEGRHEGAEWVRATKATIAQLEATVAAFRRTAQ